MKRSLAGLLLAGAMVAIGVLAATWGMAQDGQGKTTVLYDRESRYYRILVVEYETEKRLCLHFSKTRGIQSSMLIGDPVALDLRYCRTMVAGLALVPEAKDVLLVGLGGASLPKFIQKNFPDIRLDIVEIDPDVVKVCQKFFHFEGTPNTRVFVMDGRMYMKRAEKKYDVILLDAYAADHIPFHLTTAEFIRMVRDHLKPGGAVVSNLWEHGLNRFYFAELKTFQETFPQSYILPAGSSGNIIVFGSLDEPKVAADEWVRRAKAASADKDLGFDLPALVGQEYRYLKDQAIREKALTDDAAPVDTLRRENPKYFEEEAAKQP